MLNAPEEMAAIECIDLDANRNYNELMAINTCLLKRNRVQNVLYFKLGCTGYILLAYPMRRWTRTKYSHCSIFLIYTPYYLIFVYGRFFA